MVANSKAWMVVLLLLGTMAYAIAEEITLTTYYPSPRGVYTELQWGSSPTRAKLQEDQGASIELRGTGTPYLDFSNDALSDFDMRLILTGNDALSIQGGNVGIGTTGPTSLLHIGASNITKGLRIEGPSGAPTLAAFSMGGNGEFQIDAVGIVGGRFIVKDSGNVGIGTQSPTAKLDVSGTARISSTLTLSSLPDCAGQLSTDVSGQVVCGSDADFDATNELQSIVAGGGLTGGGNAATVNLDVGAGTGISVSADAVDLANPSKTCPAGQAIRAFDIGTAAAPTCVAVGGGPGGSVGTLTQGANITLTGAGVTGGVWDPNSGNATIDATGSGGGGGFWAAFQGDIYNTNAGNVGIGTGGGAGARLTVQGSGSGAGTTSLIVRNSSGDVHLRIEDDGRVDVGKKVGGVGQQQVVVQNGLLRLGNFGSNPLNIGTGSLYYNDTTKQVRVYKPGGWQDLVASNSGWVIDGANIYTGVPASDPVTGSVGIGTKAPAATNKLQVVGNVNASSFSATGEVRADHGIFNKVTLGNPGVLRTTWPSGGISKIEFKCGTSCPAGWKYGGTIDCNGPPCNDPGGNFCPNGEISLCSQ